MKEQNKIIPDQKKLFHDYYLRPIAAFGLALVEIVCVIKVTILHQGSKE